MAEKLEIRGFDGQTLTLDNGNTLGVNDFSGQWDNSTTPNIDYTIWPQTYSYQYWVQPPLYDRTAQAFKIVKALMDKKLVKLTTVKKFVDLVDEIVGIL